MSAPNPFPGEAWIQTHLPEGVKGVMKFVLVWKGRLPASANSSKTKDVAKIREELSAQLEYLWEKNSALQVLKEYGFTHAPHSDLFIVPPNTPRQVSLLYPGHMVDLCDWIPVKNYRYMPLIRKSLDLACDLSILFLRQDDPGALITQSGDLDGRIKTLLDALRMPTDQEQDVAPPSMKDIYTLMQSDTLVSALDIKTERLLFPESSHPHEVFLIIEVSVRVLKVQQANYCLL